MKLRLPTVTYSVLLLAFAGSTAHADEVEGLIAFSAGTPARASEVNDNFTAVKTAVDGTHADVVALQQAVAALQDALAALQSENATLSAAVNALETDNVTFASQLDGIFDSELWALNPYLTVTGSPLPTVLFSGVNVQIVNGQDSTSAMPNGLGNLIVGYNEVNTSGSPFCSRGVYLDETSCRTEGHTWGTSHKTGSHYVVVGAGNSYTRFGGIVAGWRNASTAAWASVTGGAFNKAAHDYSAVSGGFGNIAYGLYASVSGGYGGTAAGDYSSVSGGRSRTAGNPYGWVAGTMDEQP